MSNLTAISPKPTLASVPEILAELAAGRMVVVVDDEDRENEGDLLMASDHVTPEAINFMARYGRGLICLTLTAQRTAHLQLPMMVGANGSQNGSSFGTNFTVSIEAAQGVTTGISAADRAATVLAAVAPKAVAADIVQPGHIFPLRAMDGGVLARAGHTEAGCDLARMAGASPSAVICEILNEDGTMARLPDLIPFAASHGLKLGSIADLIKYRAEHESLVVESARKQVQTQWGTLTVVAFTDTPSQQTHLALVHGKVDADTPTLVRVHEPLSTLDWLAADVSTHSWPLPAALAAITAAPSGVVVLLNCAETAANLLGKFMPPAHPPPTKTQLDLRTYGLGAQILRALGVRKMELLANMRKMPSMGGFGLEVTGYRAAPERT